MDWGYFQTRLDRFWDAGDRRLAITAGGYGLRDVVGVLLDHQRMA
jgi:hypothetical protein